MEKINELVRARRSVRSYDGRALSAGDLEKLTAFMANVANPYGIPVTFKLLNAKEQNLSCPVVTGTELFVGAAVGRVPHGEEALGYSFEHLVLFAQSLGIGTVWIGGTMDRAAFVRAMALNAQERMPCVSPLGYPAKKPSVREVMMRKAVKADSRQSFEALFFDGAFSVPLTEAKAGKLAGPLEMVRWAPSAVNKQPWRAVVAGDTVHFYLKHSKGYISDAVGDMQKIDIGIALCHFALAAEESGLPVRFTLSDPGITTDAGVEYIASYQVL